ncbi:MAG TPA: carotenoid oxygenase family protein [Kofleriaceae bacterium]|nr:carotenoid oxygenase family protein [Kofleriaceae bacterium]
MNAAADRVITSSLWTQGLGREHGFEPLVVEGTLPAGLRGTLYRNGPGQFAQFGTRYTHPFEGDGAVTAIRIADGKALGASRLHATAGLARERAAGKVLYGLAAPWRRRIRNAFKNDQKNTANTNVMTWQGRLFALMEAGKPTEVDPTDLSTIGETDLGGVISSYFSAHPHHVPARGATYNFGLEYGRVTRLHIYELPDVGAARHLHAIELAGPPMLHDFIATDTHLVFFISPVRIDVPRMLLQVGNFEKLFRWRPEHGTEILCVPIDRPADYTRFSVDAFYQWHFANAFTRGNELVVDYVRYRNFQSFGDIGAAGTGMHDILADGILHRATIDPARQTLRSEQVCDRPCEFPTVAPGDAGRPHAVTYAVLGQLAGIGAIDARGTVTSHEVSRDERITEPLYVDGHLLALCHARDRAYVAVYDAARIPDGPIAKIHLDHHVPITFHGTFAA